MLKDTTSKQPRGRHNALDIKRSGIGQCAKDMRLRALGESVFDRNPDVTRHGEQTRTNVTRYPKHTAVTGERGEAWSTTHKRPKNEKARPKVTCRAMEALGHPTPTTECEVELLKGRRTVSNEHFREREKKDITVCQKSSTMGSQFGTNPRDGLPR